MERSDREGDFPVTETAPVETITQENIQTDLNSLFRGAIRVVLESVLEEEVEEMVGAEKFARMATRRDFRNGTYLRRVLTSMGELDVTMPRARSAGAPTHVLGKYRRRTDELDDTITQAYVAGVSTRDMEKLTQALTGRKVKRSTVSRVTKVLDEQVTQLRTSRIEQRFPYLYLDATFVNARWARAVENVSVLVAYGVGEDGFRHLLGVGIGPEESEASWAGLITELNDRGLDGVQLVIADEHQGLANAVRRLLPEAKRQRCTVHFTRNVASNAPKRLRQRLAQSTSRIFRAASLEDAKKRVAELKLGLGSELPEAMACLDRGFNDATRFFEFPQSHWMRIRSTNSLERLHRELKRRINAIGAFPDRESTMRLATAVAIDKTDIWSDRRYLDMSLIKLETTGDDQAA